VVDSVETGCVISKGIKAKNPIKSPSHFLGERSSPKKKYEKSAVIKGDKLNKSEAFAPVRYCKLIN
jgi:hypothetical protein